MQCNALTAWPVMTSHARLHQTDMSFSSLLPLVSLSNHGLTMTDYSSFQTQACAHISCFYENLLLVSRPTEYNAHLEENVSTRLAAVTHALQGSIRLQLQTKYHCMDSRL